MDKEDNLIHLSYETFPSPYSGILFLSYGGIAQLVRADALVSVPLFGDSFFMLNYGDTVTFEIKKAFPSPYSGILFLCVRVEYVYMYFTKKRFPSPYSGILFLFLICVYYATSIVRVSVPLFGDSFFMKKAVRKNENFINVSVPLFGDSFFMTLCVRRRTNSLRLVSVPLFGDSFFILSL